MEVTDIDWQARAQFFAMAAQMMRRILVDAARARRSQKRGGLAPKVNIEETAVLSPVADRTILALDEALTAFAEIAPRQAKVVELRYFGGLTEEAIVVALGISPRTVRRDWDFAKAWLMAPSAGDQNSQAIGESVPRMADNAPKGPKGTAQWASKDNAPHKVRTPIYRPRFLASTAMLSLPGPTAFDDQSWDTDD